MARLHVAFGASMAGSLQVALEQAGSEDQVVRLFDGFAFGPIAHPDARTRADWVEEVLGYEWTDVVSGNAALVEAAYAADRPPIAWTSLTDPHNCCGYLWWLSQIGDMPCDTVCIPEISMLNPDRLTRFIGSEERLSPQDRAQQLSQWARLQQEDAPFRVFEGGRLVSVPLDHFDVMLLGRVSQDWRKMARIVGYALGDDLDQGLGDLVLASRLRALAEAGRLEWRGELWGEMERCEIRLKSGGSALI